MNVRPIRSLVLLALVALSGCATATAAQSDFSGMVKAIGMPALAREISPLPAGGMNHYDPATGATF